MNLSSLVFLFISQPDIYVKSLDTIEQKLQKLKELSVMKTDWNQKRISQSKYVSPTLLTCLSLIETNNQLIMRGLQQQKRAAKSGMSLISKAQELSLQPPPTIQTYIKSSFNHLPLYEECLLQKDMTFHQEMYLPQIERQNKWLQKQVHETQLCVRREEFLLKMYDSLRETWDKREEFERPLKRKLEKLQEQADKLAAENERLKKGGPNITNDLS